MSECVCVCVMLQRNRSQRKKQNREKGFKNRLSLRFNGYGFIHKVSYRPFHTLLLPVLLPFVVLRLRRLILRRRETTRSAIICLVLYLPVSRFMVVSKAMTVGFIEKKFCLVFTLGNGSSGCASVSVRFCLSPFLRTSILHPKQHNRLFSFLLLIPSTFFLPVLSLDALCKQVCFCT